MGRKYHSFRLDAFAGKLCFTRFIRLKFSEMNPLLGSYFLLLACIIAVNAATARNNHKRRCRTTDDLGRIPYFLSNSTFHNLGYPLIRTLCNTTKLTGSVYDLIGCANASSIQYLYESEHELRFGNRSSTIIVDPHLIEGLDVASSGSYVIDSMFEILLDLGYQPGVRHWSEGMNKMFPAHVAAAAMKLSNEYDAFINGTGPNPYATANNLLMFQIEVPFRTTRSVPVNTSPYVRTFQWMIGLHFSRKHLMYQFSDPASHCLGANFFLGNGHSCSTSGIISCPQYAFHQTRSLEITPETRKSLKKNIILFDSDQNELETHRLRGEIMQYGGLNDLEMIVNQGRKRSEMPDLYTRVKMTIDCRNPGVEFINYEATLYDVMTLSCDMRATRNVFDFPVPSKYHINPHNLTRLGKVIHDSMVNYEERINDFKHFKRLSRSSSQLARTQVDMNFFSRDVLFRTHCGSYPECRRIYSWAVAVWTLYPLAMIEVVTDVDLSQESVDNDLIRLTLAGLFNSKYFVMYHTTPGVAPVDMFPRTPCAYMVYMDASFIPFSRDFLNTHVAALVRDPRPIVYWQGDKIAIAVMHARPYVKFLRTASKSYVELNFTIRIVEDNNVAPALPGMFGEAEIVKDEYISKLPAGGSFSQVLLNELLKKNPPMNDKPCDSSINHTPSFRRRTTAIDSNVLQKHNHTARGVKAGTASSHPRSHQHHLRHQQERSYGAARPRCVPHEHLIIDAIHVPMPNVVDSTDSNVFVKVEPTLWLTSSLPPIPFSTVFDIFSKVQIEAVVQHLDPVLQNSHMRKIFAIVPSDVVDALKQFDAADYPNVISLRDMEYSHWGEKCA